MKEKKNGWKFKKKKRVIVEMAKNKKRVKIKALAQKKNW